jgi:hypothetical protein
MGWLDFLLGPPSRNKFARVVMAEFRRLGGADDLRYNPEKFLLERGDGGFINLANLYQEYCQAPSANRKAVLERFIRGCVGTTNFEIPAEFDDVHPDLLPVIRSRFYLESIALQSQARGGEPFSLPHQVVGEHLSLSLVYDLPQAMRSIVDADLDGWGVTLYEAIEAARHNLEQMGNVAFASLQNDSGSGLYVSATGDNYDGSRLVLLDLIRQFSVRGETVAMVPNRDLLIVTGSEDVAGLEAMCKLAGDAINKPRPISTVAQRLEGDEWHSWLPDVDSPAFGPLHELRLRTLGAEYNDQKELLEEVHEARGEEIFVASFSAMQNKQTGRVRSYSVWSAGVPTLLPETDDVLFFRPRPGGQDGELVASGSWGEVRDVVGDLMEPAEMYPERYRVVEFPTPSQLAQIGNKLRG